MPTLEELLPVLSTARIFSSFDAKDGFFQDILDEESSKIATLWTPLKKYHYLRNPNSVSLATEFFESRLQEFLADPMWESSEMISLWLDMVKLT